MIKQSGAVGVGVLVGVVVVLVAIVGVGAMVWRAAAPVSPISPSQSPPMSDGRSSSTEGLVRTLPVLGHAESTLALIPEQVSVASGQSISIDAVVEPGSNRVSGVELRVRFDPKRLKLETIKADPRFSLELQAAKIDQSAGTASIAIGTQLTEASVVAKQKVATLSFVALDTEGTTRVEVEDTSLVSADSEAQNVLKTIKSSVVTVSGNE